MTKKKKYLKRIPRANMPTMSKDTFKMRFLNKDIAGIRQRLIRDLSQLGPKPKSMVARVLDELIWHAVHHIEMAYGGCAKCYGKGYGTQTVYAQEGLPDFERDHQVAAYTGKGKKVKLEMVVPCSCGRGEQIKNLLVLRTSQTVC